jgi:hypothetical protein
MKHAEASIRKIVVGSIGKNIPITPIATKSTPLMKYK